MRENLCGPRTIAWDRHGRLHLSLELDLDLITGGETRKEGSVLKPSSVL